MIHRVISAVLRIVIILINTQNYYTMKHIYLAIIAIVLAFNATAQSVASFDQLTLAPEKFWNGSDGSGSFTSGGVTFYNSYSNSQGYESWSGFAYSNMSDATTAGFGNQYSAITGRGYEGSSNYAVGYPSLSAAVADLKTTTKVSGLYVTNSTYAYWSMKNGDDFSKKFGGDSGNDEDWLILTIEGFNADKQSTGKVEFYLADFRSSSNTNDYILDTWKWVNLESLGYISKLEFSLKSTDNGSWGMNTPGYFCIDNLTHENLTSSPNIQQIQALAYPNPFNDHIAISGLKANARVTISDITGRIVVEYNNVANNQVINGLDHLKSGVYFLKIMEGMNRFTTKLVKK